ncbi:hypothetical protein KKC60_02190 [Patescibacteria group bacterium]|nr:hypothetical protein [Patescibacteria group bacterium]
MLSPNDKQEIRTIILEAFDQVLIPAMNAMMDEKIDTKFDEKLDEKIDTKFDEKFNEKLEPIMGELKAIRQENAMYLFGQRRQDETLEDHKKRLRKLELI